MWRTLFSGLLLVSSIGSVLQTQSAVAQRGEQLLWQLEPGRNFQVATEQEVEQQMEVAGAPMKTQTSTKTWMTWKVAGINDDGNALVDSTVTRITMTMDAPMLGKVDIDTDSEEPLQGMAAQIGGSFKPIVGVPIQQVMNQQGEVLDMTFPEDAANTEGAGPMGTTGSAADMFQQISRDAALVFPAGPLTVGQSWQREFAVNSPIGQIAVTNVYTYEGPAEVDGKPLHKIDVDTSVEFKADENQAGPTIEMVEQDCDGVIYFDNDAGRIDRSEVEQTMKMNISIAGQVMTSTTVQLAKMRMTDGS